MCSQVDVTLEKYLWKVGHIKNIKRDDIHLLILGIHYPKSYEHYSRLGLIPTSFIFVSSSFVRCWAYDKRGGNKLVWRGGNLDSHGC